MRRFTCIFNRKLRGLYYGLIWASGFLAASFPGVLWPCVTIGLIVIGTLYDRWTDEIIQLIERNGSE